MKIPKIKKRKVIKSSILADKIECIKLYDKLEPYLIENKIDFKDFIGEELYDKYIKLSEEDQDLINSIQALSEIKINILYEFILNISPIWWEKDVIKNTCQADVQKTQTAIDNAMIRQGSFVERLQSIKGKYASISKLNANDKRLEELRERMKKWSDKTNAINENLHKLEAEMKSYEYTYYTSPSERLYNLFKQNQKNNELSALMYQYKLLTNNTLDTICITNDFVANNVAEFEDYLRYSKLFDVSIHWLLCFNEYCIYSNNPTIETIFDLYKLSNAYTKEAVKTFVKHLAN